MEENLQLIEARNTIQQELIFSYSSDESEDRWLSALNFRINDLISHDFAKLLFVLYRLDVDELKLKQLLNNYPETDASKIISELIIERQLQKIKTREASRKDNSAINEDEKW